VGDVVGEARNGCQRIQRRVQGEAMKDQIEIRQWVKRGIMLINTYALDGDDPDHPYHQALAQGVVPEEFGLEKPDVPPPFDGGRRGR
jgi:hypothetical protein